MECIWLACDTRFSFISLNWRNVDRVLQNFKFRTQGSNVCRPRITLLQDIEVSNFVCSPSWNDRRQRWIQVIRTPAQNREI